MAPERVSETQSLLRGTPGVQDREGARPGPAPAAGGAIPVGSLATVRSSRTSRRAISLHVALIVFVPACVALTWWQVLRALSGNTLSWAYTVEWPIFAAYAVFMWWRLVHDDDAPAERAGPAAGALDTSPDTSPDIGLDSSPPDAGPAPGGEDDELAAYNRYLADLHASGRQKRW